MWPFITWRLDIIGPFLRSQDDLEFLLVVTYFFTKWVEASPLRKIMTDNVKKFCGNKPFIVLAYQSTIIIDNGRQFACRTIEEFCEYNISHYLSSVYYPQGNGMIERTNRAILNNLKRFSMTRQENGRRLSQEHCGHIELPKKVNFRVALQPCPWVRGHSSPRSYNPLDLISEHKGFP